MRKPAKQAKPARKPSGQLYAPQAVGAYEAAALMGVHYSRPQKLVEKGKLSVHRVEESVHVKSLTKHQAIYDSRECEKDVAEYEELMDSGEHGKRPRAWLHLRPEAIRHLQKVERPIAFNDAIGVAEAAKILKVVVSFIPRLIARGEIVGRRPWSRRGSGSRIYIISRQSCVENAREVRSLEAAGKKVGRPRKKLC
jgi:hypothetical protein